MNEYIFERVTPDLYYLLKDLYLDAFNSQMDIPAIRKRYDTVELGCEHIGFLAIHVDTGKAAAYYGVFPVRLVYNNHTILSAQSGDTMTHSGHRLKGLFMQLAKLTFEECHNKEIQLIFGFPNDNSLPGFIRKLQWKQIDSMQRLDLKLKTKTIPFSKICKHSGLLMKFYSGYCRLLLRKKIIPPPPSFTNNYPCNYAKIIRNEKYIEYKNSADKFFIKIDDQILWIRLADVLWIGDFSNYQSTNSSFIRKLKKLAFCLGYNTISFNINESVQLPAFLSSFKKYNSEPSCVFFLNNLIMPENILFTAADFDTW